MNKKLLRIILSAVLLLAAWLVNRNISLRLSYDFTNRDGSDSGSNYDRHLALLRVGFGL